MKKGLLTYILLLTLSGLQAQPRLVVSLTIDQLRSDYLENFAALYGEQGFKRLMRDGRFYSQTQFDFNKPDRASAIASIYTGTTPSVHGIIAKEWLDTSTLNVKNCVDDANYIGNYTNESSSAMQMLTTTVTDELKIQTGGKALVYAIAPFKEAAILTAGHAADCALWLNETTGKWCSTTYYSEFPTWLSQYNEQRSPAYTLKNQSWTPTLTPGQYIYLSNTQEAAFKYTPSEDRVNLYRLYCTTPLINDEINKLTEELLNNQPIGYDLTPDFLSLTYYAGGYNHQSGTDHALEIQDAYLRLDQSIAQLLSLLDRKVGMQNILFCVSSTGYNDLDALEPKRYRIPSGECSLAQRLSDGHLWRRTIHRSLQRPANLSEPQAHRGKADQHLRHRGESLRVLGTVQWRATSVQCQQTVGGLWKHLLGAYPQWFLCRPIGRFAHRHPARMDRCR